LFWKWVTDEVSDAILGLLGQFFSLKFGNIPAIKREDQQNRRKNKIAAKELRTRVTQAAFIDVSFMGSCSAEFLKWGDSMPLSQPGWLAAS